VNGASTGQNLILWREGAAMFDVPAVRAMEPAKFAFGTGDGVVRLGLSQDIWQEKALYGLFINGKEVATNFSVDADHAGGTIDYFDLRTSLEGATPNISVRFLNDAWSGADGKDRSPYVESRYTDGSTSTSPPPCP
jgi:hypothetical protein